MYLQNKYRNWYYTIIENAKSRDTLPNIVEKHHIIPKSLGGTNSKDNLVSLTPREHYICHLLLTKMCAGEERRKMVYAFWALANLCNKSQVRKVVRGRMYESLRCEFIRYQKSLAGANHPNRGTKRPDRTKESFTPEWRAKISAAKKGTAPWNKGIGHSEKTKALQSLLAKNRIKKQCPYCKRLFDPTNFVRYHGPKCKLAD